MRDRLSDFWNFELEQLSRCFSLTFTHLVLCWSAVQISFNVLFFRARPQQSKETSCSAVNTWLKSSPSCTALEPRPPTRTSSTSTSQTSKNPNGGTLGRGLLSLEGFLLRLGVSQVPGPVQAGQSVRQVHPGSGQERQRRLLQAQEQPAAGGPSAIHGLVATPVARPPPTPVPDKHKPWYKSAGFWTCVIEFFFLSMSCFCSFLLFLLIFFPPNLICSFLWPSAIFYLFFLAKKALIGFHAIEMWWKTGVTSWTGCERVFEFYQRWCWWKVSRLDVKLGMRLLNLNDFVPYCSTYHRCSLWKLFWHLFSYLYDHNWMPWKKQPYVYCTYLYIQGHEKKKWVVKSLIWFDWIVLKWCFFSLDCHTCRWASPRTCCVLVKKWVFTNSSAVNQSWSVCVVAMRELSSAAVILLPDLWSCNMHVPTETRTNCDSVYLTHFFYVYPQKKRWKECPTQIELCVRSFLYLSKVM